MDRFFASFANAIARIAGSRAAFLVCVAAVVVWALQARSSVFPKHGNS